MAEELNSEQIAPKPKRKYTRHQPIAPQQSIALPNPAIAEMESAMPALMNRRMMANQKVREIQKAANRVNLDLAAAQEELADIENEVNYRLQTIAQMKGQPFTPPQSHIPSVQFAPAGLRSMAQLDYPQLPPSPMYTPSIPYPTMPPVMEGVSSMPAQNRGLYPDASDPRLNLDTDPEVSANGASAEAIRAWEQAQGGKRF